VRDTGAGIETLYLDHSFELFHREFRDQPTRVRKGLWLAKTLREMHAGTIQALSEGSSKGTQLLGTSLLFAEPKEVNSDSKRVLIVEDDPRST
jgi:light-regulated signal transduction histidine kinase (bacteriophytochrome)